jgi:murein DD-endopeptidase MepM/ murein hydrolase activator NlpD
MLPRRTILMLPRLALAMLTLGLMSALISSSAHAGPGVGSEPASAPHVNSSQLRTEKLARTVAETKAAYREAADRVRLLSENSAALDARVDEASALAEQLHDVVQDQNGGGLVSTIRGLVDGGDSDLVRATDAADNAEHAARLAASAADAVALAIADSERARNAWETQLGYWKQLGVKQAARFAARTASRQSRFHSSYLVEANAQDMLNRRALARWLDYVDSLADHAIVPPTTQQLMDRRGPAEGLDPVRSVDGRIIPGVAELDPAGAAPIVVHSAETVRAVSEAFSRVGLPDGADSTGAAAYACGGLVARAWGAASTSVPADAMAQWRELRAVPLTELQVGDVIVLGDDDSGLTGSGIYLGQGHAILADAVDGEAAVHTVTMRQVYGVRRATLSNRATKADPDAANCGLLEAAADRAPTGSGPLLLPVADGSYTLSSGFGDSGPRWSTGEHMGQDFAAPFGTPVYAAAAGVVTIKKSHWAGRLVRIDHGAGVETWYAHMSQVAVADGETLAAGDVIGGVGSEGNSTGAHLHFEVRLDGDPVDPMAALVPTSFSATGSLVNGELVETSLCAAPAAGPSCCAATPQWASG